MPRFIRNEPEDFWNLLGDIETDECVDWPRPPGDRGYGQYRCLNKLWRTHVLSYTLTYGSVPKGKQVNHKCGRKICCNPKHLYAGSASDNMQDSIQHGTHRNQWMGVTHCIHGHKFDEYNTYTTKRGWRQCRTCQRNRDANRTRSK